MVLFLRYLMNEFFFFSFLTFLPPSNFELSGASLPLVCFPFFSCSLAPAQLVNLSINIYN